MDEEDQNGGCQETQVPKKKGKTVSFSFKEKEKEEVENEENRKMQRYSVLDTKPSHVLDYPLTVSQQLWLLFFLPTLCTLGIYIADVATDIAVALNFLNEGKYFLGGLTLAIAYLPPLVSYFIRLSSPPETNSFRVAFVWLTVETAALVLFPIRTIQCASERLFWSIEALRQDGPDWEDALIEYEATRVHVIENYLFLQAFLHAGPQAILQTVLLALHASRDSETRAVEAICVVTSIMTVALICSSYQRYETQVKGGRPEVWATRDRSFTDLLECDQPAKQQRRWVKVMEEDNPVGRFLLFSFWYLFILARIAALVLAGLFFPLTVLAVCAVHYLVCFLYILPTPQCHTALPAKLLLAAVYIFCLIEVSVQFRKSCLLYSLFFTFSILENIALTLLWGLWADWHLTYYYYSFYMIGITQASSLLFLFLYFKYFQPRVKRLEPMS